MKYNVRVIMLICFLVAFPHFCIAGSLDWKHTLTPTTGGTYDYFGYSVAISDKYAIVGHHGAGTAGLAHVFVWNGVSWEHKATLEPSDTTSSAQFGRAVAISGKYAVVGDPYYSDPVAGAGIVYLFDLSNLSATTHETAKLSPSDAPGGAVFGTSLAVSDKYAVVGASNANQTDLGIDEAGAVYLFDLSHISAEMTQTAKLRAGDPEQSAMFGHSVAVSGSYVLAGAFMKPSMAMLEPEPPIYSA